MTVLLALDVSQTSTGYAYWETDSEEPFTVGALKPPKGYRGLDRYRYILSTLETLTRENAVQGLGAVVLEGYPYFLFGQQKVKDPRSGKSRFKTIRTDDGQGPGNQVFGIAGITEMIKMKIHFQWKVPFACIPPTTIKLFGSGNGHATKKMMIACLLDEYGLEFSTDDEVDAYRIGELAVNTWQVCEGLIDLEHIEPTHKRSSVASVIAGNNPEGTLDWANLDFFDILFGRKKTRKVRRRKK